MIVGYVLENVLGFILAFSLFYLRRGKSKTRGMDTAFLKRCTSVTARGCSSYYDCATFFTFSIQLACIVVLARLDFGISASGMGDSTAKITWAISLLTMLPLMYIAFNPDLLREPHNNTKTNRKSHRTKDRKEQLRFLLFAVCWLLFIYPFLSRMMEIFGPSMIGNEAIISTSEWNSIQAVCLADVNSITEKETIAMDFFAAAGSLLVCLPTVTKIVWLAIQRHHGDSRLVLYVRKHQLKRKDQYDWLLMAPFIGIPITATSQLWTILRLRGFQEQVSQASRNQDTDRQWTFGQIAAMTIFVPVLVESWFAWLYD